MSITYNNQTFSNVLAAANTLSQPFINNIQPATKDDYSYALYSANDMQQNFSTTAAVWQNGGPIVGFNQPNQNFVAATDCSGFVARVLNAVILPGANESVYAKLVTDAFGNVTNYQTAGHPQPFPSADDYANWIASGGKNVLEMITFSQMNDNQFIKGGSFSETEPGDILAYGLPPGSTDTGHVMVINSIQKIERGILNTEYWKTDLTEFTDPENALSFYAVSVYDSSNVEHYNDRRGNANAGITGVGQGTILIITDASDAPIGFMFNAGFKLLQVEPIATTLPDSLLGAIGALTIGRIG